MRKFTALIVLLLLSATATSALARREQRGPDPACDAVMLSIRAATSPAGVLIAGFDANGDGRVDRAELEAGIERMFRLADQNHDGSLSLIELSQWSMIWLGGPSAVPGRFDFDRDADDRVSASEFATELRRRFNGFDADKDGVVTRAELLVQAVPANCRNGRLLAPAPEQKR